MAVAMPDPLIPSLAEAMGLDPGRCRSIDLHLRTNDVVTVNTVEYVHAQHLDGVITAIREAEYALVPKAEYDRLVQDAAKWQTHQCRWGDDPSGPCYSDEYLEGLKR